MDLRVLGGVALGGERLSWVRVEGALRQRDQ